MTKLLQKGIEAISAEAPDRQDMAGEILLNLASKEPNYRLTAEQLADLRFSIAEADRGEIASPGDMAETWKKFGL